MRNLTAKQKKVLDMAMSEDDTIVSTDDLPQDVWAELERINATEILWSECNRYIHDKRWEKVT